MIFDFFYIFLIFFFFVFQRQISPYVSAAEKDLTLQKVCSCSKERKKKKIEIFFSEIFFFCLGKFWIFFKNFGFWVEFVIFW